MSDKSTGKLRIWWFIPSVLVAGAVNGLLGAGGGVIMLYVIRAVLGHFETGEDLQKDTFASVVAIMLPVSVVSAVSYAAKGNFDFSLIQPFVLPALVGGVFGAYLTDRLPSEAVRIVFAVLVVISGVRMVL